MVVPRIPAPLWEGGEPPSGGRVVEAEFRWNGDVASDYDRACDCRGPEVLHAAGSWALILAGAEDAAAWLPEDTDARISLVFAFARPEDASLDALLALRAAQPPLAWSELADSVEVGPGGLLLMHAADAIGSATEQAFDASATAPTAFIGDAIVVAAPAGRYRIRNCRVDVRHLVDVTFVSFERVA